MSYLYKGYQVMLGEEKNHEISSNLQQFVLNKKIIRQSLNKTRSIIAYHSRLPDNYIIMKNMLK
jgi:hypothetical protein